MLLILINFTNIYDINIVFKNFNGFLVICFYGVFFGFVMNFNFRVFFNSLKGISI